MFGFESITSRATSLCTTQEFLLPGMDQRNTPHKPSTNLDLRLCNYKGNLSFSGRKTETGGAQAARTEGHTQGLWAEQHSGEGRRMKGSAKVPGSLKVVFFYASPVSPACLVFKKFQFPSLPQPPCTNQEMLTAGGSRLHSITQPKSNPGIFLLLPSHT